MALRFAVEVAVDPKKGVAGVKKVTRELTLTEKAAGRVKSRLTAAFGILAGGAALAAGVRTLANFSQEMSTVGAVAQATGAEFDALQEKAIQLGTNTRFSATQAAEGMTFLARAGFDANQVLGSIGDTLNLAQAGALGLGEAADIASNVLTGFRLEVDESARVVDVLALAANSANTTVSQLGQALKFVAPVAAGVGVSVEETTAAISALSNAGLQASLAGTGLRKILSELESPATKTKKIFEDLGISEDQVRVSSVGLTAALTTLRDAGVDTGLALEIFGDRGGPAFEVLRTSIPDIERMTGALGEADGTAQRIAETMDDNLNGALLAVSSAFEGLIIRFGEAGTTDALESGLRGLAETLRFLAENIGFVSTALGALAAAFAVVKLAPLAAGALLAVKAFVALQVATIAGTAGATGMATAYAALAATQVAEATAAASATAVTLAAATANLTNTITVVGGTNAIFIQAAAETQATAARVAHIAATNALSAAQAKLAFATAKTTKVMRVLSLINPFTIALAGAVALGIGIVHVANELEKIEKASLRDTEQGAKIASTAFGKLGVEIQKTQARIESLQGVVRNDLFARGFAGPAALRALKRAQDELDKLNATHDVFTGKAQKAAAASALLQQAIDNTATAVTGSIATIAAENLLLLENARAREIELASLQAIGDIKGKVTETQEEEIRAAVAANQAFREQAAALDAIQGPQQRFNDGAAALAALQIQGRITAEEHDAALLKLAATLKGVDLSGASTAGGGDLAAQAKENLEAIQGQARAESLRAAAIRDAQGPLMGFIEQQRALIAAEREGIITKDQLGEALERVNEKVARLNPEYETQARLIEELTGPTRRLEERKAALLVLIAEENEANGLYVEELQKVNEALNPLTEAEQRRKDVLDSIIVPQMEAIETQRILGELLAENAINADEYAAAMERASRGTEMLTETVGQGLTRGLETAGENMRDVGGAANDIVVNGFRGAEDALTDFIATGEADFGAFVDGLIADIARLLAKQALLAAFGSPGAGGGGGFLGNIFGGGREGGGPVNPNQAFLVGEGGNGSGAELFVPPTAGNIIPAGQTAAIMQQGQRPSAPVVNVAGPNVNITNVSDPNQTKSDIASGDLDGEIMNVMRRKRRTVRATI